MVVLCRTLGANRNKDADEESHQSEEGESRVRAHFFCCVHAQRENPAIFCVTIFFIIIIFCCRKGKKDGKQESKADKESDIEKARANAVLWELRFKDREQALNETSEAAFKLGRTNEYLTNQLYRAEQDAIDTAGHWERKRDAYEKEVGFFVFLFFCLCVCIKTMTGFKKHRHCFFLTDQCAAGAPQESRGAGT